MMFREPLDLPDEYDIDDVEPWSWTMSVVVQIAASVALWAAIAAALFYFGVLTW